MAEPHDPASCVGAFVVARADAAVVCDGFPADDLVASYLARGWTLEETTSLHGKRVRILKAPE